MGRQMKVGQGKDDAEGWTAAETIEALAGRDAYRRGEPLDPQNGPYWVKGWLLDALGINPLGGSVRVINRTLEAR
jgi:hypothetical protein